MIERALVAGLGSIGERHLRLLRAALPEADIRVLRHSGCNGDIPNADGCFDRLEDACAFVPQLAIVSTPSPFHLQAARELAQAGAHLLVEKPISDRLDGVADLLALCAEKDLVLQIGYNLRFLLTLQRFRTEIRSGHIGKVHTVHCEIGQYLPEWRPGSDYRDGVSGRADLGGGVLLELSHELDMLRWVFGEVAWVGAWCGRQSALEVDVEDSAMLTLGLIGGPVVQLGMDFLRRDATRVCTAIGATGSLRWDAVAGEVTQYDPFTGMWRVLMADRPERDASYCAQIETFLERITGGVSNATAADGSDGLEVLRVVEAARRSAGQDGRRVVVVATGSSR